MKVWLIKTGEPLPIDGDNVRLYRMGILSDVLASAGHNVLWWTSTFDHFHKNHRFKENRRIKLYDNYTLNLIYSPGYRRNVSLRRIYDHYIISKAFKRWAEEEPVPDIILCSYPTIELAYEAVLYGEEHAIPVVLDVRDLWPDLFLEVVPRVLKPMGDFLLLPFVIKSNAAFKMATAVTGITKQFVEWAIKKSGRDKRVWDRDFPMGYPVLKPTQEEEKEAKYFWKSKGINEDLFLVVFFGYLGRHFDFIPIIDAAEVLQEEGIHFVICGIGAYYEVLKKKARKLSNVTIPGWIGKNEIWQLMRMSDVGLMPYVVEESFRKSIPNKFIEYLSAGLPILTTLDGNVGSLVTERRMGAIYHSSEELVHFLRLFKSNPQETKKMGEAAKKLFKEKFRADKVYSEMMAYLTEVESRFRQC